MPWAAERTHTFRISYKQLGLEFQRRVDEAIIQLMSSEDPRKLGYRKIGKWKGAYSYEIGRKIRILYRVRFKDKTVVFLDVGTHKIY